MANANAELRRLMQLKKATSAKKINHPLAKYNNLDQLSCVICAKVIKDDSLWNPHLQSKKHKDNVLLIKNKKSNVISTPKSSPKSIANGSKISDTPKVSNKEVTEKRLPDDFFDERWGGTGNNTVSGKSRASSASAQDPPSKPKSILKNSSRTDNSCNEAFKPKSILKNSTPVQPLAKRIPTSTSGIGNDPLPDSAAIASQVSNRKRKAEDTDLPEGFFDEGVQRGDIESVPNQISSVEEKQSNETKKKDDTAEAGSSTLPEGFFDDPKKDAAARNVEYVDPKEKEWEMFQKVIQEETKLSEMIQEDDDEESEMHKDLTELNKMKSCLSRVANLKGLMTEEKQKKLDMTTSNDNVDEANDNSEDSDEDIDDIFDWRAKNF